MGFFGGCCAENMRSISQRLLSKGTNMTRLCRGSQLGCSRFLSTESSTSINYDAMKQAMPVTEHSWVSTRIEQLDEDMLPTDRPQRLLTEEVLKEQPESIGKLCDEILKLRVMEIHQVVKILETRLQISPDAFGSAGGAGGAGGGGGGGGAVEAAAAEEKTAFDVKLEAFDAKSKIKIIKEVRAATGLGLKEAKELVESAPVAVKQGLSKDEAEALQKALTDLGAEIKLE